MLTDDPTCAVLDSADVHFDGPTVDGSGCAAHKANQGCSCTPILAVHTSALRYAEAASFDVRLALAQVYSGLYIVRLMCI